MTWVKGIVGVVLVLIGLVWIGQGTGLLPGSFMTGQRQWAVIGLVLLIVGWLLWTVVRGRRAVGASTE
jgi:glucose dehydrogenase